MDTIPALTPLTIPKKPRGRGFQPGNKLSPGRLPGAVSAETKLKQKAEKVLKSFLYKSTKRLLHSQMIAAFGTHRVATPIKNDKGVIIDYTIIRDEKELERLLSECKYGTDYFVLSGADPDWRAADALLSRAYGRPKETLAVEPGAGFSLLALEQLRNANEDVVKIHEHETPLLEDKKT